MDNTFMYSFFGYEIEISSDLTITIDVNQGRAVILYDDFASVAVTLQMEDDALVFYPSYGVVIRDKGDQRYEISSADFEELNDDA